MTALNPSAGKAGGDSVGCIDRGWIEPFGFAICLQFLPHIANCRSGLRVFGNAEGVLAGKAKGLELLSKIVSELD